MRGHRLGVWTWALVLGCGLATESTPDPNPPDELEQIEPEAKGNAKAIIALTKARAPEPRSSDERTKSCPAEVGDPAVLLQDTVLLRPPKGVEFLPDDGNPTFAQAIASGGFVSACDATLTRMSVMVFEYDPTKTLEESVLEFVVMLESAGYADGAATSLKSSGRTQQARVDYAAQGAMPPTSLHIAAAHLAGETITGKVDRIYMLVYETTPEDYEILAETLAASSESILLIPPA